jgi:nicotinamide-nucleotide amidase
MSLNMALLFKTDWSVGITGYTTPVKESGNEIFANFSFSYHTKAR